MAKVLAYADPSGYVTYPTVSGKHSEFIAAKLTPLYTQEEIDASMARFYAEQGLDSSGIAAENVVPPLAESAAQVDVDAAARADQSKALTGQSIAEAAAHALAVPPPPAPKGK